MQNTPATSSTAPRIRQAVRTANAKTAPPALPRAPLLHGLNRAVLWQLAACGTGLLLSAGQVYGGAAPLWPWPAAGLRQYICPRRRAGLPGRAAIVPAAGYRLEAGGGLHRGADRPHCGPPAGPDRLFARRGLRGGRSAVGTGACHPGGRRKPGGYGQPAVLRRAGRAGGAGHPQAPHRHPARSLPVGRHGRRLFAARCPAGVCTGAGGGGVLHFVLCLRGQPGAHRRTGSCTCHGPDRCRPGALFCRAGRLRAGWGQRSFAPASAAAGPPYLLPGVRWGRWSPPT